MDLVKLEKKMPLRGYPEEKLNTVLVMDFLPWLGSLLSLTGETSAERLEIALPAIKTQCIGMGFAEIKKMFEMYADGKLSVKPIPNYFDRILLGKILEAYKAQKPKVKKEIPQIEVSAEETKKIVDRQITEMVLHYQSTREIKLGYLHLYKPLFDRGVLPAHTKEYKDDVRERAKNLLLSQKKNATTYDDLKQMQAKLEGRGSLSSLFREVVLLDYLKEATKK